MSTTTIRIDDKLKLRVAAAAEQAGKTAHAFIVDALSRTVEQVELDTQLHLVAERRWATILACGKTVPWEATRAYLVARSGGEHPRKPAARKL